MEQLHDAELHKRSPDAAIGRLAATQYGLVHRRQAAAAGATRGVVTHRRRCGRWESLAPDVFRITGAPPSWRQAVLVACLAWGPGAVASHSSAAALWRLAGFSPDAVEVTVPPGRRRRAPGRAYRKAVERAETTIVDRIPVTTVARTLLDVASVAPPDRVEEALDDALRRGLVSIARLRRQVAAWEKGRRGGVALLRKLLEARAPATAVPQSVLETQLLRAMERAGLPEPVRQHRVRDRGRVVAVVDFAYPDRRLAVEADGYRWHSGRRFWERDRQRRNALTLLGWRVVTVTWSDLASRPEDALGAIREALEAGATRPARPRRRRRPPRSAPSGRRS